MLRSVKYYTGLDQAYSHIIDEPPDQHWDPQSVVFVRTQPCCIKADIMNKGMWKVLGSMPTTQLLATLLSTVQSQPVSYC